MDNVKELRDELINYKVSNLLLIGGGRYGIVYKYKNLFAVKKYFEKVENELNPDDIPFAGIRIGFILNNLVEKNITPHILTQTDDIIIDNSVYVISELQKETLYDLINSKFINTEEILRCILFQIVYTLACILKKFPEFRHNDLSTNNIFYRCIPTTKKFLIYKFENVLYKVPNIGIDLKIADFDISMINGIVNNNFIPCYNKMYNITDSFNQGYDICFLLNQFLRCNKYMPTNLIKSLINPNNYNRKTCRPIYNISETDPFKLMKTLFSEYIVLGKIQLDYDGDQDISIDQKVDLKLFTQSFNDLYLYPKDKQTENYTDKFILQNFTELNQSITDYNFDNFDFKIDCIKKEKLKQICNLLYKSTQEKYFIKDSNLSFHIGNIIYCKVLIYFSFFINFNKLSLLNSSRTIYHQIILNNDLINNL